MGAMTLTQLPGYDEVRAHKTVHAALDAGITLFDTADVYGPGGGYGTNETVLAAALRSYPGSTADVVVATKGGHLREGDTWWIDGSAQHLRRACEDSCRRLGLDSIPLYQHHRPDPRTPYAESMAALRGLHDDGLVQRVGISNADAAHIQMAVDILGPALVSVQNEYSPRYRCSESEIELCADLGLTFLSWGPLGGMREVKDLGRAFGAFASVAAGRGVSPHQVALAWQLQRWPAVVPIPGASRPESIRDSVAACRLQLTEDELTRLELTTMTQDDGER
jgi:aryl-alcohol dehydrogenase-like predicted oxidoreductase